MAFRERHYRWTLDLNAAPEDLWPFVADTNRFNRDAGVPQVESGRLDKRLRNARRRVRLSIYGLPVEWEEQPFEWVRPIRFGVERVYSKGPMARMRVLAQLTPRPQGGTTITYDIWATPRNYVGVAAIPFQLRTSTGPSLRAAFKRYDEMASKGIDADVGRVAPPVANLDQSRLEHLHTRLLASFDEIDDRQREAVERLEEYVQRADDFAVARIRPFQLADDWDLDRKSVV